jgi:hypothetical protein
MSGGKSIPIVVALPYPMQRLQVVGKQLSCN